MSTEKPAITNLRYEEKNIGGTFKISKTQFIWEFDVGNSSQRVELFDSKFSGKKKLVINGNVLCEEVCNGSFMRNFEISGHNCIIIQYADKYELRIDNQSYTHLVNLEKNRNYFVGELGPTSKVSVVQGFGTCLSSEDQLKNQELYKSKKNNNDNKPKLFDFSIKKDDTNKKGGFKNFKFGPGFGPKKATNTNENKSNDNNQNNNNNGQSSQFNNNNNNQNNNSNNNNNLLDFGGNNNQNNNSNNNNNLLDFGGNNNSNNNNNMNNFGQGKSTGDELLNIFGGSNQNNNNNVNNNQQNNFFNNNNNNNNQNMFGGFGNPNPIPNQNNNNQNNMDFLGMNDNNNNNNEGGDFDYPEMDDVNDDANNVNQNNNNNNNVMEYNFVANPPNNFQNQPPAFNYDAYNNAQVQAPQTNNAKLDNALQNLY